MFECEGSVIPVEGGGGVYGVVRIDRIGIANTSSAWFRSSGLYRIRFVTTTVGIILACGMNGKHRLRTVHKKATFRLML